MKFLVIATISICLFQVTWAQSSKLRKADTFFNSLAFASAAGEYEKLIGTTSDSPDMQAKLAYSYFRTERYELAEKIYENLMSTSLDPELIYQYAQVLRINGKYEKSELWMDKFIALKPNDLRSNAFSSQSRFFEQMASGSPSYVTVNWSNNSDFTDFGVYPGIGSDMVYFVSSKKEHSLIRNIWTWNNDRFLELHVAEIDSLNQVSRERVLSSRINTRFHEGPISFHPSGNWVVYTRNNIKRGSERKDDTGIQNLKLYIADVRNGKWINEREFPFNDRQHSVGHPSFTSDGKWLYFASDMPGGFGGADIYKVEVLENGSFGQPINLGKDVNTEGQEMFPWISQDGHLFFSSDGLVGFGGLDVFVWLQVNGKFQRVVNCGNQLNSSYDDFALTTTKTGSTGFFASNRPGGHGGDDIYSFQQLTPFQIQKQVRGTTIDENSGAILANTKVYLIGEDGKVLDSTVTSAIGSYSFTIENTGQFQVVAKQVSYLDKQKSFQVDVLDGAVATLDLELRKEPEFSLATIVRDGATSALLDSVHIVIIDRKSGQKIVDAYTNDQGKVFEQLESVNLGQQLEFTLQLDREGYLKKELVFSHLISKEGTIELHKALDMNLDKLNVGMDLATIIDIKPIYFDYGKFDIRKDASIELDKIVKIMNENPSMVIELGSHTDCRGSMASNDKLSANRAKASAEYIKKRISKPDRIYGKGYGESKLKNDCGCEGTVKSTCSEAEHQENRRTEFIIMKL